MTRSARLLPILLSAAFLLLGIAWLAGPPGSGPDEPAHYLRALSIGRGDLFGEPTAQVAMRPQNAAQAEHLRRTTRSVEVPAGLAAPLSWLCTVADHSASAACIGSPPTNPAPARQASYEEGYLPFLYLPDGAAMRLARTATSAIQLARVANCAVTLSLLVLAIFLLWDGSPLSLVGVPLAITPTVLFTGAVINPSGAEIAASMALLAFLLRLSRPADAPSWTWSGGIAAATVLSLARPLGGAWVLFLVAVGLGFGGRQRMVAAMRAAPPLARRCLPVVPVAMILGLLWQLLAVPPLGHSPAELGALLGPSLAAVPEAFGEAIGVFGWQDTLMPRPAYAIWGAALVGLVSPALLRGRHRERRTLDVLILACFAAITAISALVELPTGFAVQGRHILPALIPLALVSGEILYRNQDRIGQRSVATIGVLIAIPAAAVQFAGWYSNAHRYAVGLSGSWLFVGRSEWSPAGGWVPWIALAAAGAVLLMLSAVVPLRVSGAPRREVQ